MNINKFFAFYFENGFSIAENVFSISLIQALGKAINDIQKISSTLPENLKKEIVFENKSNKVTAYDSPIFIIGNLTKFNCIFNRILDHELIYDISTELLGNEDLVYHFMNVTIKHPNIERKINYHRDFPNKYICHGQSTFLRFMICIDGMDTFNGATYFLSQSHFISDEKLIGSSYKTIVDDETKLKAAYCSPGSLIAIHPKVIHGGGVNRSLYQRRNIVIQIGHANATFITEEREYITGRRLK